MSKSHDNLVGKIVLKDIYVIKNTVTDKVYVGQATNTFIRWKGHKTAAKTGHYKGRSLLYEAMKKYGIDNFHYEILEGQVSNYNEREKYWISFYNCVAPNGYNLIQGGEQYPNFKGIKNAGAAVKSQEVLDNIIKDLRDTELTLIDLSKKYTIPLNTIHGINSGDTYYNEKINYPIRTENVSLKIGSNLIISLKEDLKRCILSSQEIAQKYNVSETNIRNINNGVIYKENGYDYPIRKSAVFKSTILSREEVAEIIDLILNTSLSYREIGRMYQVEHSTILFIKNGSKKYRRDGLNYPLRPNN